MADNQAPTTQKKGKNFVAEEEKQLCASFLHVSQDPLVGSGQKNQAFWDRISSHYNNHVPVGLAPRPCRSLETKWGIIKHDVKKFVGYYETVMALSESGTSIEDIMPKAIDLYKAKNSRNHSFAFIHCWLMLKDVPRWADSREDAKLAKMTPMKRVSSGFSTEPPIELEKVENQNHVFQVDNSGGSSSFVAEKKRPVGSRAAKEELKQAKGQYVSVKAQAKATADLAEATRLRASVGHEQCLIALFSIPEEQLTLLSDNAKRYFRLRQAQELQKLEKAIQSESEQASLVDDDIEILGSNETTPSSDG